MTYYVALRTKDGEVGRRMEVLHLEASAKEPGKLQNQNAIMWDGAQEDWGKLVAAWVYEDEVGGEPIGKGPLKSELDIYRYERAYLKPGALVFKP